MSYEYTTISEAAKKAILSNNLVMGRLMIAFDRGQKSIQNWVDADDVRLTTPLAVQIISGESGLTAEQILIPKVQPAFA